MAEVESAGAVAVANNPTISVVNNVRDLEEAARLAQEAYAEARRSAKAAYPAIQLAKAEEKVTKFRALLAEAERGLIEARAAAKGN